MPATPSGPLPGGSFLGVLGERGELRGAPRLAFMGEGDQAGVANPRIS